MNLRIADIAVGSGAFLVAAARYLGERLLEAWQQESAASGDTTGRDLNLAIREVVSQCLYGADINEMAVEMCKLSLWLVSLDPKKPFSFVDDKVLHGNSLLGLTDIKQLRGLHISPSARRLANPGFTVDVDTPLRKAADIRAKLATPIADQAELDPQRSAKHKKALLAESKAVTDRLRIIADGIVAAGLKHGGKPGKPLDASYENLSLALLKAFPNSAADADSKMLESIIASGLEPTVPTDYERWKPLHWVVEVPDVVLDHGGFDAVIGNPPFLGGKKISPSSGSNIRQWYINSIAGGQAGNADLVAYFFLRAKALLREQKGQIGLIATNSVAQGDTREVGLEQLIRGGMTIRRAVASEPWPSKSAALEFSAVWGGLAPLGPSAVASADGVEGLVTSFLTVEGRIAGSPIRLKSNKGICFIGSFVLGMGFILDPHEASSWIKVDPKNAEVLSPFMTGQDLNSGSESKATRWAIDMQERSEAAARVYELPWSRLVDAVKPERSSKDASKYPRMVHEWWKYWNARPGLYNAISDLDHVIVIALTSKTVMPVMVPAKQVFSHAVGVFASDSYSLFGFLSSQIHQIWALTYASTLETRIRYTPSDVFETLPLPSPRNEVHVLGAMLDSTRRQVLTDRGIGLTELYNSIDNKFVQADAEIDALRVIHRDLDQAVMAAYGWEDVDLNHDFYSYKKAERWTVCPEARHEILARLLEENHRRAAIEKDGGTGSSKRSVGSKIATHLVNAQEKMF